MAEPASNNVTHRLRDDQRPGLLREPPFLGEKMNDLADEERVPGGFLVDQRHELVARGFSRDELYESNDVLSAQAPERERPRDGLALELGEHGRQRTRRSRVNVAICPDDEKPAVSDVARQKLQE